MMNRAVFCCSLLMLSSYSMACMQLPAVVAFIRLNDQDRDGGLNPTEWMNAKADENFIIHFKLNDLNDFDRWDYNRNQRIEVRELGFDSVQYVVSPCAKRMKHSSFRSFNQTLTAAH